MKIRLLPIIFLLIGIAVCDPYSPEHTLQCSNINDNWSYEQNLSYLWNIVEIHSIDRYAFLILCPIIFILQMMLIITMIKFKVFTHSPQDVIFGLIIIQSVCSLSLFSDGVYDTVYSTSDKMPDNFPTFCLATGSINSFSNTMEHVYLLYFLVHVIFNVNKSIKQSKWFKGAFKHILPFLISIPCVVIAYVINWMGLSQLGICQATATRGGSLQLEFPIFQFAFSVGFVIFSIYTYRYFKSHMPHVSALNRRRYEENMLITRFTIGMSIIESLYSLARLSLYLNCQRQNPIPDILVFATIFNLTRLAEFLYLIVVVFLYKKIGNKIKKFFRSCFTKSESNDLEFQMGRVSKLDINAVDLSLQEKILDVMEQNNEIDFLKITQIMTMLTGIRTAYRQYLIADDNLKAIKNLHYQEQISFRVNSKWVSDYEQEALLLPRMSFLDGKFTIYSPQIFKHLLSQDNISGIDSSFDLIKNSSKLYKIISSNGGGRSGQFFFFSDDNKYILKTVPKQEFVGLLQQLEHFYQHFKKYPRTLITKFYGMFKIEHAEIYRVYYILVMKNISGCEKHQIKSIYDMKGSTDDRQVLKDTPILEPASLSPTTVYKDLDFIRIERKLYISSFDTNDFKNQLKHDTSFLQGLNIIDYSLLVMKVQWFQEPNNLGFWGPLQRIPSNNQENIYYHTSLIDVTQKWDRSKKNQNWWKKLMGKKDTSAQQPSFYQARFMHFIREITTFELTQVMIRRQTSLMNKLGKTKHLQIQESDELKQLQLQQFKNLELRTKSDQKSKLQPIHFKKAMTEK